MSYSIQPYNYVRIRSYAQAKAHYESTQRITKGRFAGRVPLEKSKNRWGGRIKYRGATHIEFRMGFYFLYGWHKSRALVVYKPDGTVVVRPLSEYYYNETNRSHAALINLWAPANVYMYRGALYVYWGGKHYRAPIKGMVCTSDGEPLNPMQEFKLKLNKERAKPIKELCAKYIDIAARLVLVTGIDCYSALAPSSGRTVLASEIVTGIEAGDESAERDFIYSNIRMFGVYQYGQFVFSEAAAKKKLPKLLYKIMKAYDKVMLPAGESRTGIIVY